MCNLIEFSAGFWYTYNLLPDNFLTSNVIFKVLCKMYFKGEIKRSKQTEKIKNWWKFQCRYLILIESEIKIE